MPLVAYIRALYEDVFWFKARPTTPRALIHKPVTGTNNIKKCNKRLLEKATPKICDQKRLAVTTE
ncbi:Maturase MatK, N-terminal domain-containing protein [Artemisia annua]|uniref:Maturase MatK, N-terminal domain-containing protein n=1 Tax=Artemisia annua TaxID=35608 RepID=A0A2U1Q3V7_ARTAN|nr:Maturase MatK, N-terminal domain-containing protein [Artemisia annua]